MAEIRFTAFLSCSFADEDKDIVAFFARLIKSFEIEPKIYDYQEMGRLPDKVKEYINSSDCLIAIASRQSKVEGSELWSCPDWIHHEIALANAYNKPIAIFVEDGVRLEGLISMEERRQLFSRSDVLANIDKITRFLFNLRTHLESMYRFERLHVPVLLRHYVHVKEEIRSKDISVMRTEVLMECLADELEATHHSQELEETTPALSVRPLKFDFLCKELPDTVKAKAVVIEETDRKYLWKIAFNPPLKKGDKVKYAYKIISKNIRPFTYEELMERIDRGTYEYNEPICEACEWEISYPTAEFLFDIEFPENYEIDDYYTTVTMGEARLKAEHEARRIKDGNLFSAEKIIDKWAMSLHVPKPLQGHTYYIYYRPPKAEHVPIIDAI